MSFLTRRRVLAAAGIAVLVPVAVLGIEVQIARTAPKLADNTGFRPVALGVRPGADPLHVLWLGDSTTTGVGSDALAETMAARVAVDLGAAADRGAELTVLGVSGAQVHEVLDDQLLELEALVAGPVGPPDVVLISVGANDVTALTRRPTFEARYERMLTRVRAVLADAGAQGTQIVAVGIPDMGTAPRLPVPLRQIAGVRAAQLDDVIAGIAADRAVRHVDLADRTSATFSSDPERYFAADEFHPSADGHHLWADAVVDALA